MYTMLYYATVTSLHLQVFWCSKSIPVLLVLPSSPVLFCKILMAKNSDFWLDLSLAAKETKKNLLFMLLNTIEIDLRVRN